MDSPQKQTRNCLNSKQRTAVYVFLSSRSKGQLRLPYGVIDEACEMFDIGRTAVKSIWRIGRKVDPMEPYALVQALSPNRHVTGRKKIELPIHEIKKLEPKKRRTVRALAKNVGIPKSTVQQCIDDGRLLTHSNSIKPYLTEKNEVKRLQHCLDMLGTETLLLEPTFRSFEDFIHVDEKWFNLSETVLHTILAPGEKPPHRSCKSKRFIPKLMFLSAIARPRFDEETNEIIFDGKIGIWPFVRKVVAKRSSKNRQKGTMETKSLEVNRDEYRKMLIDNVLPAIKRKFPRADLCHPIFIQQDNAGPHIHPDDTKFASETQKEGLKVQIICQPPNSPDLNINDLGFFRAIDALRQEETANTLEELIGTVQQAFDNYCPIQLNKTWITYQQCMIEIMKVHGANSYKLPHMGKDGLIQRALLEQSLSVPLELVEESHEEITVRNAMQARALMNTSN